MNYLCYAFQLSVVLARDPPFILCYLQSLCTSTCMSSFFILCQVILGYVLRKKKKKIEEKLAAPPECFPLEPQVPFVS